MSNQSPVICLLTDFGLSDIYVGVMKGVIARHAPHAQLIDLTHQIPPQNVPAAAMALAGAIEYFPKQTVFLAVVDPGVGTDRAVIAAGCNQQRFIAPDNGLLPAALDGMPLEPCVRVTDPAFITPNASATFHGRDIFAPLAAAVAMGHDIRSLGPETRLDNHRSDNHPKINPDGSMQGTIIAVDHFGNLTTNVKAELLPELLAIRIGQLTISEICHTYAQVPVHMPLALVGSTGYLEIAVNQGNAARQYNINTGTPVYIDAVAQPPSI